MKLKNKVAVITGAASGIGLACAKLFTQQGAHVVMADIAIENLIEEAQKINAVAVVCDIRDKGSVRALVEFTINKYDKIDILINNAAVAISGNVMDMDEDDWNEVINTNLTSAFRTIKETLPYMIKNKCGSIINMSSTQAYRSWHDWTAYATAKGGLLAMTRQLAGQFAVQNIRFNSISPGTISSPLNDKRFESEGIELFDRFLKMHAMGRLGEPEEVAAVASFLASNESSFITGEDIKVDGGLCVLPRYSELNTL